MNTVDDCSSCFLPMLYSHYMAIISVESSLIHTLPSLHWPSGPESMLTPSMSLFGQQQPLFQPMPSTHTLGPPPQTLRPSTPVVVAPDPLLFPLYSPLSAKPPAHLQLMQGPPCPVPCPVPPPTAQVALSTKPQEEEAQIGATDQDATLDELCKPLYCKLCNVTLNSAQQAQAHYQGKNHSKKLRNFYAGSQQLPAIRIPEVIEPVSQQPLTTPPTESTTPKQPVSFNGASRVILATENDYCKLCDASFSSPAVAQAHYQGKNHAKRLRLAEAQQSSSIIESTECVQRRLKNEGSEYKLIKNRRTSQVPPAMPGRGSPETWPCV
ncbi:zinc finger matrin-type protein 3-like isoform X3 [Oncorhynchus keta]|uniref:zinc finger matrin-type protein 3-like isoform X3 n=1 Tax=Oncorhynchus keta TaxID=8018 RepID=UPI0015FE60C1|nr:zinc finger matrin-type protein 3-like isoform X3 [Oncorhynchus keta]